MCRGTFSHLKPVVLRMLAKPPTATAPAGENDKFVAEQLSTPPARVSILDIDHVELDVEASKSCKGSSCSALQRQEGVCDAQAPCRPLTASGEMLLALMPRLSQSWAAQHTHPVRGHATSKMRSSCAVAVPAESGAEAAVEHGCNCFLESLSPLDSL